MCKNGEDFVVDFVCAKCHRIGILRNLTDIRRNALASFGLCVERVPVVYQHPVASASSRNASISICSVRVIR
jgi:hypothetical protein